MGGGDKRHNNSTTNPKRHEKRLKRVDSIRYAQPSRMGSHTIILSRELQLLSLLLTRPGRKAMPNLATDNAPPLVLVLVERMAQACDLVTSLD